MSNPLAISFDRQLAVLRQQVVDEWRWPSPDAAFACHVSQIAGVQLPPHCAAEFRAFAGARFDQAPLLASCGYILPSPIPSNCVEIGDAWMAGLNRLVACNPFTVDRQSFAYRPYEVLGICLGASRHPALSNEVTVFLRGVISNLQADTSTTVWGRLLAAYAELLLFSEWPNTLAWHLRDCDLTDVALLQWMAAHSRSSQYVAPDNTERQRIAQSLMDLALTAPKANLDIGQLVVFHNSLLEVVREAIGSSITEAWHSDGGRAAALRVIEAMCRRFPLFAKKLLKRHAGRPPLQIQDEYDVQDLLHALLVLHFDDVRAEEYTPSYAATTTRMDFVLKQEKIVIEVKMTRKGLDQKRVIEELAVDKMCYRAHQDCRALVCFVYDPTGICHNPVVLENDASEDFDGFRVHVIVAPQGK